MRNSREKLKINTRNSRKKLKTQGRNAKLKEKLKTQEKNSKLKEKTKNLKKNCGWHILMLGMGKRWPNYKPDINPKFVPPNDKRQLQPFGSVQLD